MKKREKVGIEAGTKRKKVPPKCKKGVRRDGSGMGR